jgi:ABC-2 type transport system permease protein
MSTTLSRPPLEPAQGGVSFPGILAGEWIKLRSLRSTWWTTASIVPVTALIAVLVAATTGGERIAQARGDAGQRLIADAVGSGLLFQQLIVLVLGTGMIRSSFAAVPTRTPLILGKAVVVGVWALGIGVLNAALSFAVAYPLLVAQGARVTFGDPSTLIWSVLGPGLVLGLTAIFALAIGTMLTSSAGALSLSVGILFVLTIIVQIVASTTGSQVLIGLLPYLLSTASEGVVVLGNGDLDQWASLAVVCGWAGGSLALGLVIARRRDI